MPGLLFQRVSGWLGAACVLSWWCCGHAHADCEQRYSSCFSADNVWPEPFAGSGLAAPRLQPAAAEMTAGISLSYQRRPLLLQAAAPDPYGNEIPILKDWGVAHALFAWAAGPLDVGLVLPVSLGATGTGLAGITTRTQSSSVLGIGAPHLQLRWWRRNAAHSVGVTQEVVLPGGAEQSFLGSAYGAYAPKLVWQWDPSPWWLLISVGARLQRSVSFGLVRMGSSAVVMAAVGRQLGDRWSVFAESWALPALQRDEGLAQNAELRLQRVPAELLLGVGADLGQWHWTLGVGSSLALSSEHRSSRGNSDTQSAAETSSFAGPPAPTLRAQTRLTFSFGR